MSTVTLPLPAGRVALPAAEPRRTGLARIWQAIIEAQQARANREVAHYLSRLTPPELEAYGFKPADVAGLLRKAGRA